MWILKTITEDLPERTFRILAGGIRTIGRSTGADFIVATPAPATVVSLPASSLPPARPMPPTLPIQTERLLLRELTPADAPFILELVTDPAFLQNIGDRGVRDLDTAARYIADGPAASYARNGFGLWRVELRDGG